jgi:uncharacterized protein YjiK
MRITVAVCGLILFSGCAGDALRSQGSLDRGNPAVRSQTAPWPVYTLKPEGVWQLNLPSQEQFDASGLLWTAEGALLTVNDRGSSLYRIVLSSGPSAELVALTNCFTSGQLASFQYDKVDRYDCEGIAQDALGRIYICEEANRWVLRCDSAAQKVERLNIDWTPVRNYFSSRDANASLEGIAIGNGVLYVANERSVGRIIAVDLQSLRVTDHFSVQPAGSRARDVHYTDLSWADGALFVLLREGRCVLKVDPARHRVLAQYNFTALEENAETKYHTLYPTGNMEGLAVDHAFIWLVTDNNGLGRVRYPKDQRPTLFRCPRPDIE